MAVYTEVTAELLAAHLARYDVGRLVGHKGITEGVENTNYLVTTDRGRYILTLYEKRVDPADLPFFLGLMEHLSAHGVVCPLPVRDRSGAMLGTLAGRPAALVTFLEGSWPRTQTVAQCGAVGEALGRLHVAADGFTLTRLNALGIAGWQPLFERFRADADRVAPGLSATIADELTHLQRVWPATLPAGVIHADLFPDNVFFQDGRLSGLIDFYFACNDARAYDLAVSLNAWCFTPDVVYDRDKGRAMIAGYQRVRPLEASEVDALPTLARGAALRFLLTRAYDWLNTPPDALVVPHDPIAYLKRLMAHRAMADTGDLGLDRSS